MSKRLTRGAGVLLPIGSLPSLYGIGSFGEEAYRFVDYLKEAGQRYWQVLPMGPTGYGDSPYQSFSAFAGNPYFIDLATLYKEGLLTSEELTSAKLESERIEYETLYYTRYVLLRKAASRFDFTCDDYTRFTQDEQDWLHDYALYTAIKSHFNEMEWTRWERAVRLREAQQLAYYEQLLGDEIRFIKFCQFEFFKQWFSLKEYANRSGIQIIGDIPIYVSADSADVWANTRLFELDAEGFPTSVAGVPPDYFSEFGQRWGNPLYRYDVMCQDGFLWWKKRMSHNARLYDVIRIDHFIGISRYYAIPASCQTAVEGEWRIGPGEALIEAIESGLNGSKIIAEDLGTLHPSVVELLTKTGYPGMRVLQFAFDGNVWNNYLPHNYVANTVVYGGTHDNNTMLGYCASIGAEERRRIMDYVGVEDVQSIPLSLFRMAYRSVADVVIFQMQDILGLDAKARMNTPATLGGNWEWRMTAEQLENAPTASLRKFSEMYGRRPYDGTTV